MKLQSWLFRSRAKTVSRSGGPIAWKSIRQNQTALSSCEAKIMATNECATELQFLKHRANDIGITEAYSCTKIYDDNKASVKWAVLMTSKGIKRANLWENMVFKCHQSIDVDVDHIPGIINNRNIFTKYMKDNTHFGNIRYSRMVSLQAFLKYSQNVPTHIISANKLVP